MDNTPFDPTRRRLCPDGECIGLIGADGRCKVCGRSDSGRPVAAVGSTAEPSDADGGVDSDAGATTAGIGDGDGDSDTGASGGGKADAEARDASEGEGLQAAAGGFDPKRRLCEDGTCVGVVGADGVCSVCGRRAEG